MEDWTWGTSAKQQCLRLVCLAHFRSATAETCCLVSSGTSFFPLKYTVVGLWSYIMITVEHEFITTSTINRTNTKASISTTSPTANLITASGPKPPSENRTKMSQSSWKSYTNSPTANTPHSLTFMHNPPYSPYPTTPSTPSAQSKEMAALIHAQSAYWRSQCAEEDTRNGTEHQ